jgi:hypothetical protein
VQPDACVCEQHQLGPAVRIHRASGGGVAPQREPEQRLPSAVALARRQRGDDALDGRSAIVLVERVDRTGEHRPELAEDGKVARGDQLADLVHDFAGDGQNLVLLDSRVRAHRLEQLVGAPQSHVQARRSAQHLAEGGGNLFVPDESPRGARGPGGERAPVGVVGAEAAGKLNREIVVALGDQEVPPDRVGAERDDPLDALRRGPPAGLAHVRLPLEQDLGRDFRRAAAAADQVDREMEIGMARRESLGEGQGVAGLHEHVEPPALHLAALVLVPFVK